MGSDTLAFAQGVHIHLEEGVRTHLEEGVRHHLETPFPGSSSFGQRLDANTSIDALMEVSIPIHLDFEREFPWSSFIH